MNERLLRFIKKMHKRSPYIGVAKEQYVPKILKNVKSLTEILSSPAKFIVCPEKRFIMHKQEGKPIKLRIYILTEEDFIRVVEDFRKNGFRAKIIRPKAIDKEIWIFHKKEIC